MRKKICVQEADEIEIQFKDRSYLATFNMRSIGYLQQAIQGTKLEEICTNILRRLFFFRESK